MSRWKSEDECESIDWSHKSSTLLLISLTPVLAGSSRSYSFRAVTYANSFDLPQLLLLLLTLDSLSFPFVPDRTCTHLHFYITPSTSLLIHPCSSLFTPLLWSLNSHRNITQWSVVVVSYINVWLPALLRQSPPRMVQATSIIILILDSRLRLGGP